LTGATVKVCKGPYKSCRGRVIEVKGSFVRVELESQMKVVTGKSCDLGKYLSCLYLCIHMFSELVVCS
jgi:transcription elongation factor